jgi:hypothetical protein
MKTEKATAVVHATRPRKTSKKRKDKGQRSISFCETSCCRCCLPCRRLSLLDWSRRSRLVLQDYKLLTVPWKRSLEYGSEMNVCSWAATDSPRRWRIAFSLPELLWIRFGSCILDIQSQMERCYWSILYFAFSPAVLIKDLLANVVFKLLCMPKVWRWKALIRDNAPTADITMHLYAYQEHRENWLTWLRGDIKSE